jgi:hypothetical protein
VHYLGGGVRTLTRSLLGWLESSKALVAASAAVHEPPKSASKAAVADAARSAKRARASGSNDAPNTSNVGLCPALKKKGWCATGKCAKRHFLLAGE